MPPSPSSNGKSIYSPLLLEGEGGRFLLINDQLQDQVAELAGQGIPIEEAMAQLAGELLVPNSEDYYPAFFTTIRWFLGDAAENVLQERDYVI